MAGRQSDVADVLPGGPVRSAESGPQRQRSLFGRPVVANWNAVCSGRRPPEPAGLLRVVSRHRDRSLIRCILAALARTADVADGSTMVPVAAAVVQRGRRSAAPIYAVLATCIGPARCLLQRPSAPLAWRFDGALGARLRPARHDLWAMGVDLFRPVLLPAQPAAALRRLLLRWVRHRQLWHRSQRAQQRGTRRASLAGLARVGHR